MSLLRALHARAAAPMVCPAVAPKVCPAAAYIFIYYVGGSAGMDVHGDSIFTGALIC